MKSFDEWENLQTGDIQNLCQPEILVSKSYGPHIIPKTKGLEESLVFYV